MPNSVTVGPDGNIFVTDSRAHRIELAVDVGDDRDVRGLEIEPAQHPPQRFGSRSDDRGVEGVADRQHHRLVPG